MSLATDDIITNTENPKECIKMLLELVSLSKFGIQVH